MKRLRVTGLCLVAVFAFSAVVVSGAQAAPPKYVSQLKCEETPAKSCGAYPLAFAANASGDVYVADETHSVVDEFGPTGKYICQITGKPSSEQCAGAPTKKEEEEGKWPGETPQKELHKVTAVAVNASGDVYVASTSQEVVDEFSPTGAYLAQFNGSKTPAKSWLPEALAVNASGDVYVSDALHDVVDEFEPNGTYMTQVTGAGTPAKSFEPYRIAVNGSGDVYVVDTKNIVVDEFEPNGTYKCQITGTGSSEQCAGAGSKVPQSSPYFFAVAVNGSGDVYVSDAENNVVDEFSSAGAYLTQFNGSETPAGSFYPYTLGVNDAKGYVYVGDAGTGAADVFEEQAEVAAPPKVTEVVPDKGSEAGGTKVTIKGEHLEGASAVEFAALLAAFPYLKDTATEIEVETPAHAAGAVEVCVETATPPKGCKAGAYTYVPPPPPPAVTSIAPTSGSAAGGTAVTIKGTGFVSPATVKIGSAATSVKVESATEIKAKTAATVAGGDEVVVSDANGTSTGGPTYTYVTPPKFITKGGVGETNASVKIKGIVKLGGYLEDVKKSKILCTTAGSYKGVVISATETKENVITFTGCEKSPNKCHSGAEAEGTIVTNPLKGVLGILIPANLKEVGIRFSPESGPILAEFKCGATTVKVEGSVIGAIKGVGISAETNKLEKTDTLGFKEAKGIQTYTELEGPEGLTNEQLSEGAEKYGASASITLESTPNKEDIGVTL